MKLTNIKFVLVLLVLLIIIGLLGYSFYNNYNYNYNYKVQEKFTYTPSNPDEVGVFNKLSEYSNIMTTSPQIVSGTHQNIDILAPQITSKQDYLENLTKINVNDLKIIEYSLQNDINKIHKLMDGSIVLPIPKTIIEGFKEGFKEGFNGTPQFPIPTSLKIFEKFADTNDWRTEWNNKLLSIYNTSSITPSPKDMNPVVDKDKTEFYILKNPKLEENLNNTSSQIIKNNLDNISNKLKSQWLQNKF